MKEIRLLTEKNINKFRLKYEFEDNKKMPKRF